MSADQQDGKLFDSSFYLGLVVILAVVGLIIYGATRPTPSAENSRSPIPSAAIAAESPTPTVEESTAASMSASAPAPTASIVGDRPTLSVNSALVACEREVLNRTGVTVKSKYQTGIIGEERTDEHLFVKVTVDAKSGRDKAQMVMECWATGSDEDPRVVNVDVY